MSIGPDGAGFRACSAAVEAIGGVSARCAILSLSRSSRLRLRLQRAVAGRILGSLGILRILLASSWPSSVLRLDRMDPNGLPIARDLFVLPPATSFSFPRSAARLAPLISFAATTHPLPSPRSPPILFPIAPYALAYRASESSLRASSPLPERLSCAPTILFCTRAQRSSLTIRQYGKSAAPPLLLVVALSALCD